MKENQKKLVLQCQCVSADTLISHHMKSAIMYSFQVHSHSEYGPIRSIMNYRSGTIFNNSGGAKMQTNHQCGAFMAMKAILQHGVIMGMMISKMKASLQRGAFMGTMQQSITVS